ncbi:hypothetical protein AVEN_71103-1 [Araneus ventricosus]|uniref:Uncharacterized protein n=1 Tax=Araneus ventricosus TaxID=182803 RepID=A0A4Y2HK45_ARAVE|nr:hypothetical protein AVEN_71103-1 [Araneus ventricosus]
MAQRGHERRAEETVGQRNNRLSAMVQRARERRLNVIEGQNHHQIQTFYAARTVLHLIYLGENVGREERKKQKNNEIEDCQTWYNEARREKPKKSKEQRNGRLVRQDVSRDLKE